MNLPKGKVLTVQGPVDPSDLGRVLMHEHLHCDIYDWEKMRLITQEKPMTAQRREYMFKEAVPLLQKCAENGCHAFVEATPSPWRAWPAFYVEASKAANIHIVLCTGFYREVEVGAYWVKTQEDAIWPFVRKASVDELTEFCVKEVLEGVHGTQVHAGAIKLASSQPKMTEAEEKIFVAGARAQKQTGVHITTHCTNAGVETSQLQLFLDEGVDLNRVVVGHTAWHLMNAESRKVCVEWMERGANFLPTTLDIAGDQDWRPLIEAIHGIFEVGLGDKILFGLDHGYVSESRPFAVAPFMPSPPFLYMFTDVLPAFRKLGLTKEEEETIMLKNPQKILPIQ